YGSGKINSAEKTSAEKEIVVRKTRNAGKTGFAEKEQTAGNEKILKNLPSNETVKPAFTGRMKLPANTKKYTVFYKPMLATLVDAPFDDKDWVFELKWDGYRAIAEWQNKQLKLYSRNGISFSEKFPAIAEAV